MTGGCLFKYIKAAVVMENILPGDNHISKRSRHDEGNIPGIELKGESINKISKTAQFDVIPVSRLRIPASSGQDGAEMSASSTRCEELFPRRAFGQFSFYLKLDLITESINFKPFP